MARFAAKLLLVLILAETHGFYASAMFEPTALNAFRRVMPLTVMRSDASLRSFHSLRRFFSEDFASQPFTTQKRFLSRKQMDRFVQINNPCIDGVFQYGFSEPSILSDFLNAALEFKGEVPSSPSHEYPRFLST